MATPTPPTSILRNNEYKIILIGAVGVGKTSLLMRYVFDTFEDSPSTAISEEKKKITIGGQEVVLDLWDTAGQEKFRTLTQRYYESVDGVILVYACDDEESFEDISKYWFPEIMRYLSDDDEVKLPVLIVENKQDLRSSIDCQLSFEHTKELAHQTNLLPPLQCSAKDGEGNVKKIFHVIATEIFKSRSKILRKAKVKTTTHQPKSSSCSSCGGGTRRNNRESERLSVRQ